MVSFFNTYGKVSMSGEYFAQLILAAVQSGFGVAGMKANTALDNVMALLRKDSAGKGVLVREEEGKLMIELHIKISYGLNIAEAVRSLTHRVKYVVEEATGLAVKNVKVAVDDIV